MGGYGDTIREEVSDRLGRELPDSVWRRAFAGSEKKLRHIVTMYGNAGGARDTTDYMAQIVIETIRAQALADYTAAAYEIGQRAKREETGPKAGPQGHTPILTHNGPESQGFFTDRRTHTHETGTFALG